MVPKAFRPQTFWLLLFVLVVATGTAYRSVTQFDSTNFDDPKYVYENGMVQQGLTWEGARWAFTTGFLSNWHPLTWLSYQVDVTLFGMDAGAHHAVSVVIHCVNVALVFWLFARLTSSLGCSAFVAAMFGLHPLHVESVAWIAERKDVLSALFGVLALLAYQKYVELAQLGKNASQSKERRFVRHKYYWLTLFLFALGLMSKSMLVTLPLVMLLLDFWPLQRAKVDAWKVALWPLLREKIPFLLLSFAVGVVTIIVQSESGAVRDLEKWSLPNRFGNAAIATVLYLAKTIWPVNLAPFYPLPETISWDRATLAVLLLAGITIWVLATLRRAPYRAVGWFWFLIMLAPVIGLLQVGMQQLADRYTYLPHLGLFTWIGWEVVLLTRRAPALKWIGVSLAVLMTAACWSVTQRQVSHWRDSGTLFRHTLAVTDKNMLAHNNLGYFLYTQGDLAGAIAEYEKAIVIMPTYTDAHSNLGRVLADQKRYEEAAEHFQTVLRLKPRDVIALNNQGNVLAILGRHEEAIEHFRRAIDVRPDYVSAHINWGLSAEELGRGAEAVQQYREVLRINPDAVGTLNSLAWLLATHPDAQARNGVEALQLVDRMCRLTDCSQPLPILTLAAVKAELGEFVAAAAFVEQALELTRSANDAAITKRANEMLEAFRNQRAYRSAPTP